TASDPSGSGGSRDRVTKRKTPPCAGFFLARRCRPCAKLHPRSWGRPAPAVRAPNTDRCLPKCMGNAMSKYLVACLVLALSACGGGGSNVKDTPPPPPPPPTPPPPPPPPPVDTSPMVVD